MLGQRQGVLRERDPVAVEGVSHDPLRKVTV
jgi:hypothetical protein